MWPRVIAILSFFVLSLASAQAVDPGPYLTTIPEGSVIMEREHTYWSVHYCPDNTCDLLHISTAVHENDVQRLALGFFVYFSSYLHLNPWQEEARENETIQMEINRLSNTTCPIQRTKQLVECRLKALSSTQKLEIFSVRFDEGERKVTPLLLSNILQSM
ncbi:MAG: hypothetical protein LZF64_01465 [Nitrosomonas sp.]|uniref:hypothetical protein n=1 Tax=Nitrosomonas sp. TaxID=42353 RepID=UPI0025DCC649|nr:hypothetical protein [Nitrosomonas sp.]UJP00482.1 MAG: hypothetical protein LZF64_01465 [Nitrosomonas sp.]UJP01910.1 MAG: hypothetical protein LZF85_08925 [Nitrosomonas sp.]